MTKTFVIGECGSCHEGTLTKAFPLIDLAAYAGCDAAKFQLCTDYDEFMRRRKLDKPPYDFSIKENWLPALKARCDEKHIQFMCTVYIPRDVVRIDPFVKCFKISAFEKDDGEFIALHRGKPRLVSGLNLHCVSLYPCPDNKAHLEKVYFRGGLSDHTRNPLSGAIAVALGARTIETHFRLDDTSESCPDYCVARSPAELIEYVRNIRQAEILIGK